MKNKLLTGLILALLLSGCSAPKEENAKAEDQQKRLSTITNQPLEQAKGVEKQVFDNAERQKKQADDLQCLASNDCRSLRQRWRTKHSN